MTIFARFAPCRHCRRIPNITTINGWIFAQCPCGQGVSIRTHNESDVAEAWNHANRSQEPIHITPANTVHA